MTGFDQTRRAVLRAVADTLVPSIDHQPDVDGFWARSAGDLGVPDGVELLIAGLPAQHQEGLCTLLDSLAAQGFARAAQPEREQLLRTMGSDAGPQAAQGVGTLMQMTLLLYYGMPDPATGQNPNWRTFGYPGPVSVPPVTSKPIVPLVPEDDALELETDVVIVGSGAGGGVIAGVLTQQGMRTVVLEAGGYFDEADFDQLELSAYQRMYWRGGPQQTANFDITLLAGATLGGGTRVNWTNCLRTPAWVRRQWAREYGLSGVDGPEFDAHLDAVLQRISANDRCSDLNGPHQRMKSGAAALGWSFVPALMRNADPARYDPVHAGYMGFGEQNGAKQDTAATYLVDAFAAGAKILTDCFAERVLVDNGRAAGVEAVWAEPHGARRARVVVRAQHVVVACGALESPALLMRSGLGGPAVGRYLRMHPVTFCLGLYDEDQRAWWGPPMSALVDQFAEVEDGYGFLIEGVQYSPGLFGAALPFVSAAQHRATAEQLKYGSIFIGLLRDHGSGQVTLDASGRVVPDYAVTDTLDVRNTYLAIESMVRLHHAAGAREIHPVAAGAPRWRRGEDLEAFIAGLRNIPLRYGGFKLFCAHLMGTCRMGTDPATSVAGPFGELHDMPGVWIGDGSALPTPSGTNPMISIMALAHRTAAAIAAAGVRSGAAVPGCF